MPKILEDMKDMNEKLLQELHVRHCENLCSFLYLVIAFYISSS